MSAPEAIALLREYLHQQAASGQTHVTLDEAGWAALQRLNAKGPTRSSFPAVQPKPPATPPPVMEARHPVAVPSSAPSGASSPSATVAPPPVRVAEPERTFQAVVPSAPSAPQAEEPNPDSPMLDTEVKREELRRLAVQAENSDKIRGLGTMLTTMVFATGNVDADIMFIGEAPGAEEERKQEPFVGPAGQLLTKIIQAMGLRRGDVYISNICKYRPMIGDGKGQGSKNRAPTVGEMHVCLPFIVGEINIIRPKVIVALGATASTGLGIEGSVGKLRGQFHEFRSIPVMVTYHPSFLLRREQEDGGGVAEKRLVWEDMILVMEHAGLPVSEKQRAYFTRARG